MSSRKKTDAKQDAVIDQLKANQLALTDGFKDLINSNRDVLTLQQELPFPGIEEQKEILLVEPNNDFNKEELQILQKEGMVEPNKLLNMKKENLEVLKSYDKRRKR